MKGYKQSRTSQSLNIGDEYYDYELEEKVILTEETLPNVKYMVVRISSTGRCYYGYATVNKCKNLMVVNLDSAIRKNMIVHSKDVFVEGSLVWDNLQGKYYFSLNLETMREMELRSKHLAGQGIYPYSIPREYGAAKVAKYFKEHTYKFEPVFSKELTDLVPHTFGIEYETCNGAIPEEECFKAGLIPLKDGSITGNEYATVVMDSKDGFDKIKYQTELLNKYTAFNKNCSLHMHFGGFDLTPAFLLSAYLLCYQLQKELAQFLPEYSFDSHLYKANGKDYCKWLPKPYMSFNDLYLFLNGQFKYMGSMTQPHPADVGSEAKWNIKQRYYWVNFINACFYKKGKTIEFRILRPTTNFNKIVNWLYVFNSILVAASKFADKFPSAGAELATAITMTHLTIKDVLNMAYPDEIAHKLDEFLGNCRYVCMYQSQIHDPIGEMVEFEDDVLTTNILDA